MHFFGPCTYVTAACISCVLHVVALEKHSLHPYYVFIWGKSNVLSDPKFDTSPKGIECVRWNSQISAKSFNMQGLEALIPKPT